MLVPPYSSSTVMPCRPRSPSFFHRSAGNSFFWSTSAARGAISSAAKDCTVSRSISMVSPRWKSRLGMFMNGSPPEFESWMALTRGHRCKGRS